MTNPIIKGYHAKLLEDLDEFFQDNAIPEAETKAILECASKALTALRNEDNQP